MRALLRHVLTFFAAVVFAVFLVVAYQNIEVLSQDKGLDRILLDGWKTMTALGLAQWLAAGVLFFGGASVALWADRWLREVLIKRKVATECGFILAFGESWSAITYEKGYNVDRWSYSRSGSDLYVVVDFDRPVIDGHIFVATTSGHAQWVEVSMSNEYALICLSKCELNSRLYIGISAEAASGESRRQQPYKIQDARFSPDLDVFVQDHPNDVRPWYRRLLRNRS